MKTKQQNVWWGSFPICPLGLLALLLAATVLSADEGPTLTGPAPERVPDLINMKGVDRPTPLAGVTIEQRLNSQLPLDEPFKDENGKTLPLGAYFGKRPIILALVYYDCPMLCTQILNGMVRAAKVLTLDAGKDYDVIAISFDAREGPKEAAAKKAVEMKDLRMPGKEGAWHFLTGDLNSIKRVTDAVGFRYKWDVHTAQFAHASAIYILTPEGKLSKYFYGIDYSPKDMRLGLVEASRIKSAILSTRFCYSATTSIPTRPNTRPMPWACYDSPAVQQF